MKKNQMSVLNFSFNNTNYMAPYSMIGIGLGLANLSLAIAIKESGCGIDYKFLTENHDFDWDSPLILDRSPLHSPFTNDLATPVNPKSEFTFLEYLNQNQRLDKFLDFQTLYPSRLEYADYLTWSSEKLKSKFYFGYQVISLHPFMSKNDGVVDLIEVSAKNNLSSSAIFLANSLIFDQGYQPYVPPNCYTDETTIIHSHNFQKIIKINSFIKNKSIHVVLIIEDTQVFESLNYLINYSNEIQLTIIFSINLTGQPNIKNDQKLINEINRLLYFNKFTDRSRVSIINSAQVYSVDKTGNLVKIILKRDFSEICESIICDYTILATGYKNYGAISILENLDPYLQRDTETQKYIVDKDNSIRSTKSLQAKIYLQDEFYFPENDTINKNIAQRSHNLLNKIIQNMENRFHKVTI